MSTLKTRNLLQPAWQAIMSDYVTAIAWTPDQARLAACSACGEVILYDGKTGAPTVLQAAQGQSIDVLAISHDGQFLAAGGQAGVLSIWEIQGNFPHLLTQLEHFRVWLDCLAWNPRYPELAFGLGRYVQVWDGLTQSVITTLNFEDSSVLDLAWHPQGQYLSVSGNQSVKTWERNQWDNDPQIRETGGASVAIVWSPDGNYLASGNSDYSLLLWEQDNRDP
jgi:WD40 repeat protein